MPLRAQQQLSLRWSPESFRSHIRRMRERAHQSDRSNTVPRTHLQLLQAIDPHQV
ncbi:MAG: hypothetical protein AAGM36_04230 [Cyanobacteria bacterium J06597_1]